jgi:Bacterial Ig-like domain
MGSNTRALYCALVAAAAMVACGNPNTTGAFAVTAASIAEGATGIATNASLGLTFNRAPLPSSVVAAFSPAVAFTPSYQDVAALFVPNALFTAGTAYTFTLTATDSSGQALAQPLVIHFTTATAGTGTDTTPPSAVVDLAVVAGSITDTGVTLSFTAPGDDGATGTATAYEIRYLEGAACPNTAANFATGTLVVPVAAPHAAGTLENVPVTGLAAGTSYCFMMRAADEVPNFSALSNVATATTTTTTDGGTTNPTPPGAIADLRAVIDGTTATSNPNSVSQQTMLTWTAPADSNGDTVASYQIRYGIDSGCPITQASFATAIPEDDPPAPGSPGSAQSYLAIVPIANDGLFSCVAIESIDAAGTVSAISNVALPPLRIVDVAQPGALATSSALLSFSAPTFQPGTTAGEFTLAYILEPGNGCPQFGSDVAAASGAVIVDEGPASGQQLQVSGLSAASAYCGALEVSDTGGDASWSNVVEFDTNAPQPPPDTMPPGPFSLTAENETLTSVDVAFTDVGDNGDTGTAASYQLEYTKGPCGSTFDSGSATQVTGLPAPKAPGTAEVLTVPGLSPGQTYCIQLSIFDAAGNSSSATVSATTAQQNPVVTAVTPADGSSGVSTTTPITVTFSEPMDASTVTAQASAGPCTGSVQITGDVSFANCVGIASVAPDQTGTTFTLTLAAPLNDGARYDLKVTAAALGTNGLPVTPFSTVNGFVTAPAAGGQCTNVSPIVISQVYGGGGSSGAFYKQDFIELHNTSGADFTIPDGGWSLQYAPPSEIHGWTAINQTILPAGTVIKASGYLLVRELPGVNDAATPVPVGPDDIANGTIGLSPIDAKVALVSNTTLLDGPCFTPGQGAVVDFVAYGAQFGTGACTVTTPALSNTTSAQRGLGGCLDTGSDFTDFSVAAPAPRNSLSAPQTCTCP